MARTKWLLAALAFVTPGLAFTPEQLISAPRRSEAIPDPSGKLALFSLSQYSFEKHDTTRSEWQVLDLKSGDTKRLTDDADVSEIAWLGDGTSILYVNGTSSEKGAIDLWVSDAKDFGKRYKAGTVSGPLEGFKVATTKSGDINFVGFGQSTPDGKLFNPEAAKKPLSTARIYDSLFVRHWDYYLTTESQAVFSGTLKKGGNDKKYNFDGKLTNLVTPVKQAESPYPPDGGSDDYDISPDGKTVVFMSKAPELPKANHTTSYIYVVPHDGSKTAKAINKRGGDRTPEGIEGASAAPVFSPDGKSVAYVQMAAISYESDRNVIYIADVDSDKPIRSVAKKWDRSPGNVKFTPDGKTLYAVTEDEGTFKIFTLPIDAKDDYEPKPLKTDGAVSSIHFIGNSKSVLVSGSAIWSSTLYSIAKPNSDPKKVFYANEQDPELKGLGPKDVDSFYAEGYRTKIHSLVVKPTNFDKSKKYPLAFLIHGGPQVSWANSWSTRWNPKVWADQGYVVVMPNPTGGGGYGQKLVDDITNDWGGAPYKDLVKVWEHVRDNIDYIDVENGVAAGASYGGFMVNWIQGQDLGRKFKAMVSHDGTFVGPAKIGTDELFFIEHDFNGTIWESRDNYDKFDCSAPEQIERWGTPQLVIHSDLDYRLPISEGLGLFNVLQERGVPSRFLNFPDETHWVLNQENSLVWHQQCLGWINKYSGVAKSNPDAVKLEDTTVPVVNKDAGGGE